MRYSALLSTNSTIPWCGNVQVTVLFAFQNNSFFCPFLFASLWRWYCRSIPNPTPCVPEIMITRLLVTHSTLPRHEIIYFCFILFYSILFYSILPNFFFFFFSILFLKASRNLGLENAKISRCFFDTSNGIVIIKLGMTVIPMLPYRIVPVALFPPSYFLGYHVCIFLYCTCSLQTKSGFSTVPYGR